MMKILHLEYFIYFGKSSHFCLFVVVFGEFYLLEFLFSPVVFGYTHCGFVVAFFYIIFCACYNPFVLFYLFVILYVIFFFFHSLLIFIYLLVFVDIIFILFFLVGIIIVLYFICF